MHKLGFYEVNNLGLCSARNLLQLEICMPADLYGCINYGVYK